MYLVEGNPGTGKTTMALQFLLEGRLRGEATLYVTLSETTAVHALPPSRSRTRRDDQGVAGGRGTRPSQQGGVGFTVKFETAGARPASLSAASPCSEGVLRR